MYLPRKVEQMYSDIWLPDLLDSEKWDSSLFNMRLNWNKTEIHSVYFLFGINKK